MRITIDPIPFRRIGYEHNPPNAIEAMLWLFEMRECHFDVDRIFVVVIVVVVTSDNSAVVDGAGAGAGVSVTKGVEDARWMSVTDGEGKVGLDGEVGLVDDSKSHGYFL